MEILLVIQSKQHDQLYDSKVLLTGDEDFKGLNLLFIQGLLLENLVNNITNNINQKC